MSKKTVKTKPMSHGTRKGATARKRGYSGIPSQRGAWADELAQRPERVQAFRTDQ